MKSYAIYRMPLSDKFTEITQTSGDPLLLRSVSDIGRQSGFVIAPFEADDTHPIVVINGHHATTSVPIGCKTALNGGQRMPFCNATDAILQRNGCHFATQRTASCKTTDGDSDFTTYSDAFRAYHDRLLSGKFRKIVLARTSSEEAPVFDSEDAFHAHAKQLFFRACHLYPRLFVALVSTPQTGTWLAATPEILLDGSRGEWHTMALAGTMALKGEQLEFDNPPTGGKVVSDDIRWSDKNISEQRYVATYINDCLARFATDIIEEGPYTTRAGNLVHLRSDFSFRLADNSDAGQLIAALQPTPAVCGLPKEETYRFIIDNEPAPRSYYSGFMGPFDADGDTHLYVSLRCMEMTNGQYRLHAGGGLLKDSNVEQEWEETEAKMQTMKKVILQDNV